MKTSIRLLGLCIALAASVPGHAAERSPAPSPSRDPLAWLGPLPDPLTDAAADDAFKRAVTKALTEVAPAVAKASATGFKCRKPAEVGPVPALDAVDRYIAELPASREGSPALDGLFRAAAQGNWLARGWVFNYLYTQRPVTPEAGYRMAQLAERLRETKAGPLYAILAADFTETPVYPRLADGKPAQDNFDLYAALHDSYPAQFKVGQRLQGGKDKQLADIGKQMTACATSALPGYRKVFGQQ